MEMLRQVMGGRKDSNPLTKGKHLTQINDDYNGDDDAC